MPLCICKSGLYDLSRLASSHLDNAGLKDERLPGFFRKCRPRDAYLAWQRRLMGLYDSLPVFTGCGLLYQSNPWGSDHRLFDHYGLLTFGPFTTHGHSGVENRRLASDDGLISLYRGLPCGIRPCPFDRDGTRRAYG